MNKPSMLLRRLGTKTTPSRIALDTPEAWLDARLYFQDLRALTGRDRSYVQSIEAGSRWEYASDSCGTGHSRMYNFMDALVIRLADTCRASGFTVVDSWEIARDIVREVMLEIGIRRLRTEQRVVRDNGVVFMLPVMGIIRDFEAGGMGKSSRVSLAPRTASKD